MRAERRRGSHSGPWEPLLSPAGGLSGALLLITVLKRHANTLSFINMTWSSSAKCKEA